MTNTSNQTYKELSIPYFKEVFDLIDETLTQLNIPYYLVGVSAIAMELLKKGIKPSRGTKDIDFAIMISSVTDFDRVVSLLEKRDFCKVKAPCTLYHSKYKTAIDLLPFGQIEENDTVNFTERNIDLHVLGYKEVMAEAVEVNIEEKIARIPPLHGMIILKLIAWNDRPEDRDNDLHDILLIIRKYFELESDEIFEKHFDVIPDDGFDQVLISARVLGRKIGVIIANSDKVQRRILEILNQNIETVKPSKIASDWARKNDWSLEYATQILKELKRGIDEVSVGNTPLPTSLENL